MIRERTNPTQRSARPKQRLFRKLQRRPSEDKLFQRASHEPRLLSAGDTLALQRTVGNTAVQRMLKPGEGGGVIQRKLPTSTELIMMGGKAGKKLIGKSSYSLLMKAVDEYNELPDDAYTERQAKLATIGQEISNWFNSPERGKKTGKAKKSDEKKRVMLEGLLLKVNNEMRLVDQQRMLFEEQMHQQRVGAISDQAMTITQQATARQMREANVEGQTPEQLQESGLMAYGQDMDQILTGQGETPGRAPVAQDWRGTTRTSKIASALGAVAGQDYFKNVLIPAFSDALKVRNEDAEINPDNIQAPEEAKPGIVQTNAHRIERLYAQVMQLFTPGQVGTLPHLFIQFCGQLYELAVSKGMEEEQAYLLVSSQVFLRTINPMLFNLLAAIPEGESGKNTTKYLMKLIQDDANNVPHGQKEPYMAIIGTNYQEQLQQFVAKIVAQSQLYLYL
jgi:hypothetical protein